jgi:hypothetical protein
MTCLVPTGSPQTAPIVEGAPRQCHLEGLGLMESCRLTRDIGYQTNGERDLPRFGALVKVKPILPACLILINENIGLQWGSQRLRLRTRRKARIVYDLTLDLRWLWLD